MRSTFLLMSLVLAAQGASAIPKGVSMRADDAFQGLEEKFTLRFVDAVTGKPVEGARVRFEGEQGTTDADGGVTFNLPADLPVQDSTRPASVEKPGYVSARLQVKFAAGTIWFNRYALSPTLPPGQLRVVLTWSKKPADLDAHLVKEGGYHISFRDRRKVEDQAWLDRDDMDGEGPETITLLRPDRSASYKYFVHDFTNARSPASSALAQSRARVAVYGSTGLLNTFEVSDAVAGTTWQVLEIRDGQVIVPGAAAAPSSATGPIERVR